MSKWKYKKSVYLGKDEDGKDIRKWVYANSKQELEKQKVELQEKVKTAAFPTNITFGSYSARWFETYKSSRSVNTRHMYETLFNLTTVLNKKKMSCITVTDLQEVIRQNWDHAETCKKLCMMLKAIFKRAQYDGIIQRNPAVDLERPKVVQKEKRALSEKEKEVIRSLIQIDDKRLSVKQKMFLACLYYFGLRPEEARALMPSDFNFEDAELVIQRAATFDINQPILKGTKTENVRRIPIPSAVEPLLKHVIAQNKGLYLVGKEDGGLLSKTGYMRMWGHIKAAINTALGGNKSIDATNHLMPYTFRRNYATMLYYSGISIKKAAYYMGHADTKMIISVYAQIDDSKESIEKLRNIV